MRDKRFDKRPTDPTELLLIRVGHHLWRSRKRREWPESVAMAALETVWAAKEAYRVPLREKWLELSKNRKKQMEKNVANASRRV